MKRPISELVYDRRQIALVNYRGEVHGPLYANPEAERHLSHSYVAFYEHRDWLEMKRVEREAELLKDPFVRRQLEKLQTKIDAQDRVIERMQTTMSVMAQNWTKALSGSLACPFESGYPSDMTPSKPCSSCGGFGDDGESSTLHCVG